MCAWLLFSVGSFVIRYSCRCGVLAVESGMDYSLELMKNQYHLMLIGVSLEAVCVSEILTRSLQNRFITALTGFSDHISLISGCFSLEY